MLALYETMMRPNKQPYAPEEVHCLQEADCCFIVQLYMASMYLTKTRVQDYSVLCIP